MNLSYLLGVCVRWADEGKDGQSSLGTGRDDHTAAQKKEAKTLHNPREVTNLKSRILVSGQLDAQFPL